MAIDAVDAVAASFAFDLQMPFSFPRHAARYFAPYARPTQRL
jgi:hypothetical protein